MGLFSRKPRLQESKFRQQVAFAKIRKGKAIRLRNYIQHKLTGIDWRLSKVNTKLYYLSGLNDSEKLLFANARRRSNSNIQQIRSLLKEIRDEMSRLKI